MVGQAAVRVRGGDKRGGDLPVPLQPPANHDFARGTPPAMALAASPNIPLVGLAFPGQALTRQFARAELA